MSIFRSAGFMLLRMVFSTRYCGCGPKELVCSVVHCVWVCIQTHTQCTYRCPKHVELFMTINHNCCIKLVPHVILITLLIIHKQFVVYPGLPTQIHMLLAINETTHRLLLVRAIVIHSAENRSHGSDPRDSAVYGRAVPICV